MKSKLLYLLSIALLAACSAPKYASYHFDHYNYNAGKKSKSVVAEENVVMESPQPIKAEELVASTERVIMTTVPVAEEKTTEASTADAQITKSQKKELKAAVKDYVKKVKNNSKSVQVTQALDRELKLAAIFGAIGIVGIIIGGDIFFIIGGIALIIGVVFLVKWLLRQ
jgi:hypothetical protein